MRSTEGSAGVPSEIGSPKEEGIRAWPEVPNQQASSPALAYRQRLPACGGTVTRSLGPPHCNEGHRG